MPIYFRKIFKFIKTIHKSLSYNSLILHVKFSFVFFYKKVSQSHSSAFFTPAVSDEGQPPIHNIHLKGGPTTGEQCLVENNSYKSYSLPKCTCNAISHIQAKTYTFLLKCRQG